MCLEKLVAEGLSANAATEFLSTLTGALVLANALSDTGAHDRATKDLLRRRKPVPA
jgi:TetR/AcrR family transcriptional repressor of nem operon